MKKVIKSFILALVMLPLLVVGQGKETSAATQTRGDGVIRTIQFGGQNLYLDFGTQNDAIARAKSDSLTQKVYFEYHPEKNAYKIYSASNTNLILAWNDYFYSTNVFFTNDGNLDEHYWVVEEDPSSNKYYLRNYKKTTGYGYLGARHNEGYMNVSIGGKDNYNNHYTEVSIYPSLRNDTTINNVGPDVTDIKKTYKRILSVAKADKYLGVNYSNSTISISNKTDNYLNQCWKFEYFPEKDAYKIRTMDSKRFGKVLAWDSNHSDKVIAYESKDYDDQYWRIERVGTNRYVIKNYRNPNKVLDASSSYLKVSNRTNSKAQQFEFKNYF